MAASIRFFIGCARTGMARGALQPLYIGRIDLPRIFTKPAGSDPPPVSWGGSRLRLRTAAKRPIQMRNRNRIRSMAPP
jgi:hypothetical protein